MAWDTASTPNKLFRRSRRQLTVWYTGVMAVVLGLSGFGVYEAIAHAHHRHDLKTAVGKGDVDQIKTLTGWGAVKFTTPKASEASQTRSE